MALLEPLNTRKGIVLIAPSYEVQTLVSEVIRSLFAHARMESFGLYKEVQLFHFGADTAISIIVCAIEFLEGRDLPLGSHWRGVRLAIDPLMTFRIVCLHSSSGIVNDVRRYVENKYRIDNLSSYERIDINFDTDETFAEAFVNAVSGICNMIVPANLNAERLEYAKNILDKTISKLPNSNIPLCLEDCFKGATGINSPFEECIEYRYWGWQLFFDNASNSPLEKELIELVGPARCIIYGPYLRLPIGTWRASVAFDLLGKTTSGLMSFDVFSDQADYLFVFPIDDEGAFVVDFDFQVGHSNLPTQIRLFINEGQIEGLLRFKGITLTKGTSEGL
jgi:hypothetical protein